MREKIMELPKAERLRVAVLYSLYKAKIDLDNKKDKEIDEAEQKFEDLEKPILQNQMALISG